VNPNDDERMNTGIARNDRADDSGRTAILVLHRLHTVDVSSNLLGVVFSGCSWRNGQHDRAVERLDRDARRGDILVLAMRLLIWVVMTESSI